MVHFQGRQVATLRPSDSAFTFGRGSTCTLRFAHDAMAGRPDRDVSRHAGSIRWDGGVWVVCNDSATRPFDIVVRGVSNPLPPRSSPDSHSVWAVSPPGLDIRIPAPSGPYLLSVGYENERSIDPRPQAGRDSSTNQLRGPTDHERLLLAAKFLALPDPGDAVGNREAAEYATAARSPGEPPTTESAVGDCVGRWCQKLQQQGVIAISGRDNINQLGRQLLAWGVLRQEDRYLLRPWQ
ncbi:MAG: hypothetical protein ACRDRZ_06620 [Pseudonocardiaceae bacterium]